ncbi:Uncharacterized protein HZ326_6021 [Fusarium oxysporum f. sp. albedinis]|nr:Uncharacterized protein HZ326_6021 [Fusarium oxysporum f. sp. albedinis]
MYSSEAPQNSYYASRKSDNANHAQLICIIQAVSLFFGVPKNGSHISLDSMVARVCIGMSLRVKVIEDGVVL